MPYLFPLRFYIKQYLWLTLGGLACFAFSRTTSIDLFFSDLWFNSATGQFPLTDNYWLEVVNHHYFKYAVAAIAVVVLAVAAIKRDLNMAVIALLIGMGPIVVGTLKSLSHHSCPWDLLRYGGSALEYPLLGTIDGNVGSGRCFPGGHASGGFGLLALYFLIYPFSARGAKYWAWFAIAFGLVMGFGQVMRGAHFFSHNLWSLWWVWLIQVSLYGLYSWSVRRKQPKQEEIA